MSSALNHRYPAVQGELEVELEDEFELEAEDEYEGEDEMEGENFLGALGGIARTVGSLLGEEEYEGEEEAEAEFEFEFETEAEVESEAEFETEDEAFVNPIQRVYRDAELMAHLARRAADAEGEEESEAFIGALIPIAARLIPRAAALVARNAPALIRGATRIARRLRQDPATRRFVQALPVVLQRTAQSLADQSAAGRPVTPASAIRTLATMTGRVLSSPASTRKAIGAVGVFDRRFQRRTQRARTQPTGPLAGGPAYGRPAAGGSAARRRRSSSAVRRGRRTR